MSELSCIASCKRCEVDGDWSAIMNDDFLHRIRVEPPPKFLARLKSRLDLQPPPTTRARARPFLRALAIALFAGAVFAVTFLALNHTEPETTATIEKPTPQSPRPTPPFIAKPDAPKIT